MNPGSSRRMFLRAGGRAALVIPVLPSLLPRTARAQSATAPVRYLQVLNPYAPTRPMYYGNLAGNRNIQANVNAQSLAEIGGDISHCIGAGFNPYKKKLSVLRGLDTLVASNNHQYTFATCASSYASGLDGDEFPPVSGQASVDTLIARSAKVYTAATPAVRRVVNLNPVTTDSYSNNRSFSWQVSGTAVQMIRPVKKTQAFFDAFATGFGTSMTTTTMADPRELALVQAVHQDYKNVAGSARLSAEDRQKLEQYMSLINDIENDLKKQNTTTTQTCAAPVRGNETDIEATITNQFRILAAAMACDLTRVASITLGMGAGYDTRHTEHHAIENGGGGGLVGDFKLIGGRVARLLSILDGIVEPAGTLLDNSLVYWSMQYGCSRPIANGQHVAEDMPVLVAGGARGQLQQGNFIDYRAQGGGKGIGINNLLVTFMNCMGLGSADYETKGPGFGHYPTDAFSGRPNGDFWNSTPGRRAPLPFFYQGPARG